MSAHAVHLPAFSRPANLRPFDVRRDLLAVADLVELCFAPTLDSDGHQYILQMRQAARAGRWLPATPTGLDAPLMGMVWVEDGRLVGNLSLIPQYRGGKTRYLIANVAVHPTYQGRGIARQLTLAALQDVRNHGRHETWLQVDETNATAIHLYTHIGFTEQFRRTSWRGWPAEHYTQPKNVRSRQRQDWVQQDAWLAAIYPEDVRWQLPLHTSVLEPGLRGSLQRIFGQQQTLQWAALERKQLRATLSWQSSSLEADRLWLAADPHDQQPPFASLLAAASDQLHLKRKLALNYPAGLAVEPLQAAGFHALRTLIWMRFPWEVLA
ncbi:MAG TPA: GNAT family N-acetyltransferase [Anaerolineales bacterium]|nr:GNAT family N-acetyltransferase [Anaerolineales bacterium]HRQ92716.1 GNAT family N-acetyltransferase [Anaerolineales bacterium]